MQKDATFLFFIFISFLFPNAPRPGQLRRNPHQYSVYKSLKCIPHVGKQDETGANSESNKRCNLEKPRDFDPFGQAGFAHLWLQYD